MLIRIKGGNRGIKEYLENGQKKDRFYTRDEMDERVILDGDVSLTDAIINSMDTGRDKYFHITLAFKEDYIDPETLANINQDFKNYFLAGYAEHEIDYYAEAHLPKIKSYVSVSDGKLIERKPHIHIVIPRLNTMNGTSFNPSIKHIIKYINAFQEHTNAKYGLESPKDNLRTNFNNASEVISRYKGDVFEAHGREQKSIILDLILKHNPTNLAQLETLLTQNGYEVKFRNKADATASYLNIKQSGDPKGMNLKDAVFSDEFLRLPLADKLAKLNPSTNSKYIHRSTPKETEAVHQKYMQEWLSFKALEMKFISHDASDQERKVYNKLSPASKITYLSGKQQKYYEEQNKFLEGDEDGNNNETTAGDIINLIRSNGAIINDLKTDIARIGDIEIGDNRAIIRDAIIRTSQNGYREHPSNSEANEQHAPKGSIVDELIQQNDEHNKRQTFRNFLHELNSNLHADVLLELTEKTHGIQPELYFITKDRSGADRIKCGTRNLSLVDFCTKELNLSFKETVKLLDNAYNMQNDLNRTRGWSIKQDIYLREQYKEWFKDYKLDRLKHLKHTSTHATDQRKSIIATTKDKINAIRANKVVTPNVRAEQINILKAEQIIELKALTEAKKHEQTSIRDAFNLEMQASYRKFLSEQAKLEDEIALEELRRLRIKFDKSQNEANSFNYVNRYQEFRLNITHEIDNEGNICYKLDDKIIIKDTGKKIEVIRDTNDNIKLTLELAMAKFGRTIELAGTADFRAKVVEMAVQNNYKVEFLDEYSKQYHAVYLEQLKDNASKLADNLAKLTELKPHKCIITAVDKCDIIDNNSRFKQVTIYKSRSLKDNEEFIIANISLDYLQRKSGLDLKQVYEIKQSASGIKFNLSSEPQIYSTHKDHVIAEEFSRS